MKHVLTVGATYTYVPRKIFLDHPGLDMIAQSSGNYVQNVSKPEHDTQLMMKVARDLENNMPYNDIKESVKKTKVRHVEALPGMFNFLRKFGGQKNMQWTRSSASFIRGEVNTARRIGADVWDAMGHDLKGSSQFPRLRHGLLCLMYTDPNPRIVVPSDVKCLSNKETVKSALKAETLINEVCDAIAAGSEITPEIDLALCKFGAECCAITVKKSRADLIVRITKEFNIEFDALALGHLLWLLFERIDRLEGLSKSVMDCIGNVRSTNRKDLCPLEYKAIINKSAGSSTTADQGASNSTIRDASADTTAAVMQDAGWHVGELVVSKDQKDIMWTIQCFAAGKVVLCSDTNVREVDMQEFQARQWLKTQEKTNTIIPATTSTVDLLPNYTLNLIKSVSVLAIHEAKQREENADKCCVRIKPSKAVEVTEDVPKGKLVIAPLTSSVNVVEKSKCKLGFDSYSSSQLLLGSFALASEQYCVFAGGVNSSEATTKKDALRAPFWGVKTTETESEANCKLSLNIADLKINHGMIDQWMGGSKNTNDIMKIPVIVSSKALKKGDALVIFQPTEKAANEVMACVHVGILAIISCEPTNQCLCTSVQLQARSYLQHSMTTMNRLSCELCPAHSMTKQSKCERCPAHPLCECLSIVRALLLCVIVHQLSVQSYVHTSLSHNIVMQRSRVYMLAAFAGLVARISWGIYSLFA